MTTPDREKALALALAQIEKNHGKGSVMRLGDDTRPPIGVIPTGSIALDVALGVGGLPRGRIVEIYGPESSGKCLTADTHLWTDHGLETVAELFARCGQPASCTSRTTDVQQQGIRMVNERGELEPLAAITHNNRRPTLRLTVRSGRTLTLTHNHPLRVMSERGFIVWRKAADIGVGDAVVSAAFGAVEASAADGLSEDEAVLLGYLVAEGSLSDPYRGGFTSWDPEVGAEFSALARHVFDAEVRCYYGKEYRVSGKRVRESAHERYGLDYVTAAGKTVPACVRAAGHKAQRAFLSALFEGAGWIDTPSTVGLGTASEQLAREVQLLLYGLGVPASVSSKYNKTYERGYWAVTVNPAMAGQFLEQIGFRSQRRKAQVAANFRPSSRDAQLTNIPHLAGLVRDLRDGCGGDRELDRIAGDLLRTDMNLSCSRGRLVQLVEWCVERADRLPPTSTVILRHLQTLAAHRYTYEAVVAIDDAGLQPTFDVMLPDTHSFLANGMLSHNTTVALHAVASAQAAGGIAAFIDAEHALDPEYAKALGVDTDNLLVSQPDTGEQALEIADMLIRSGALDIIVVDSVAALVPRAEIEGEMGDSHVGLQARLMSQALRKITGALSNSGTTMIFINQLREKIGVMFGCGSYGTRVTLADGTQEKIGKIVSQKLPVEVLSYDMERGEIVPKKVVNWFDNGPTEEFLQITVARPGGNGRAQMGLTANHLVRTPGGWREAGELMRGDRVLLSQAHRLGPQQLQVVLGGLMGDANLSRSRVPGSLGTRFRMGHGAKRLDYLDWKASLLGNIGQSRTTNPKGAGFVDLTPLPELAELREAVYLGDGHKHLSWEYLKALTPLGLAIWYCDDGSFQTRAKGVQERTREGSGRSEICVKAMSPGSRERLGQHLADTFGLYPRLTEKGARRVPVLVFAKDETAKLHELIAPYVHPSMRYKLLERFHGRFAVEPEFVEPTLLPMPAPVLDVRVKPRTRSMHRFDIEVEGSHNYLADGVIVHNSPETTTGGKALKFYASVRLDIRRIETLKDGADSVGNRTRVKVVKNKCLAEGTRVFDPSTGSTHRIEDIVDGRLPVHVAAADKAGFLHVRPVVSWFDQGEQDVIGLRLRDGTELWVTPDHQVRTERGWTPAGDLGRGDRVARPREILGFGHAEPFEPAHARMLGYLVGDGYVGGRTPTTFVNVSEQLHDDAAHIAADLGCKASARPGGIEVSFSHRPGEKNELLELCRSAGIWGKLAWEKRVPAPFFAPDVSAEVVANLLFGLFETDGWVGKERTGGIRAGYATTSEQLAHQIHWLLLRWGIGSSVHRRDPRSQRGGLVHGRRISGKHACWEVRVSGIDNVSAFSDVLPTWGPRGQVLAGALAAVEGRLRGSQQIYLSTAVTEPLLDHLRTRGLSAADVARLIGETAGDPQGGMRQVLGASRLRRDRVRLLADALDDVFLRELLADQLAYAVIREVLPVRRSRTFDVEVDELHNLVADGVVVHNCAPPFKQAEFDILYGHGISREGSLVDVGVEQGIVRKSGAWYTYEGDQLGQGKENARKFLRENPDVAAEIEKRIKEKLGIGAQLGAEAEPLPAPGDF